MRRRDDIKAAVAAVLIVYSILTALAAQGRVREASALRRELAQREQALSAEAAALKAALARPAEDELIERLARERLGLIRQGEIIFYFD